MSRIKSFTEWVLMEADPALRDKQRPGPSDSMEPGGPDGPGGTGDMGDPGMDAPTGAPGAATAKPTPPPVKPALPIDATEDDGRVKSDDPEYQAKLVIHPDVRLKFKMRAKADLLKQQHDYEQSKY